MCTTVWAHREGVPVCLCACVRACVPRHKSRCFRLQCLQALLDLHESLHGPGVGHYRERLRVLHLSSHTMVPSTANHNPILRLRSYKDPLQHILKSHNKQLSIHVLDALHQSVWMLLQLWILPAAGRRAYGT